MADITVAALPSHQYLVTVADDTGQTQHRVTMKPAFYESYQEEARSPERLLTVAFDFILEREPKESILAEFDVTVISRYFPGFEEELRNRLRA